MEDSYANDVLKRLQIPKFNWPHQDCISEKVKAYRESISYKLRWIGSSVRDSFYRHNNYNVNQHLAVTELCNIEQIDIYKLNKDGKIVIVKYCDYDNIMINKLGKFTQLTFLTKNNLENHLKQIKKAAEDKTC